MEWYQDFMKKYNETLKTLQGIKPVQDDSLLSSDLTMDGSGFGAMLKDRKDGSPLTQEGGAIFPTNTDSAMGKILAVPQGQGQVIIGGKTVNIPKKFLTQDAQNKQKIAIEKQKQIEASQNKSKVPTMEDGAKVPMLKSEDIVNQPNEFFTKVFGMNKEQMMQSWKDKGGFDALMSNPAFMIGLSFLQSSAQGKTISESALNNILKGGGIAGTYKKLLADKTEVIQPTEGDLNKIKSVLNTSFDISAPILRKLLPGNQAEKYEQAVEDIALAVNKKVRAAVKAAKSKGQDLPITDRLYKKIIQEMIDNKEIDKKGGFKLFGYNIIDATLEAQPLEHGGTAHKGETYLVGEKGPEVFIPKETGEVVANDDSQVFTMLLAANPQLQKISKERAMKILKAKFPEYFD
jgi:hypothetical protein